VTAQVVSIETARKSRAQGGYLTKTQLSEQLEMSPRWIEYQVAAGMPSHLFGNRRRFRLAEVEDWLAKESAWAR